MNTESHESDVLCAISVLLFAAARLGTPSVIHDGSATFSALGGISYLEHLIARLMARPCKYPTINLTIWR